MALPKLTNSAVSKPKNWDDRIPYGMSWQHVCAIGGRFNCWAVSDGSILATPVVGSEPFTLTTETITVPNFDTLKLKNLGR